MGGSMRDNGKMECSMAKGNIREKMRFGNKDNGKTVKG